MLFSLSRSPKRVVKELVYVPIFAGFISFIKTLKTHLKPIIVLHVLTTLFYCGSDVLGQPTVRKDISLDKGWRSIEDGNKAKYDGFETASYNDKSWKQVDVPHNW